MLSLYEALNGLESCFLRDYDEWYEKWTTTLEGYRKKKEQSTPLQPGEQKEIDFWFLMEAMGQECARNKLPLFQFGKTFKFFHFIVFLLLSLFNLKKQTKIVCL